MSGDAREARRWRESGAAAGLIALGLALSFGLLGGGTAAAELLGLLLALAGGGWLAAALPRARLAGRRRRGPGIVAVREGAIAYFGPETGGMVSIDALAAVEIARDGDGRLVWRLHDREGGVLAVPAGAEGAEALADALVALPGFRAGEARRALEAGTGDAVTVWSRPGGPARLGRANGAVSRPRDGGA